MPRCVAISLRDCSGFSLIEIVVALALLGIILGGILGNISSLLKSKKQQQQTLQASLIAEGILETLKAAAPQGILALSPHWKEIPGECLSFSLKKTSQYYVAYDASGSPIQRIFAINYEAPFLEKKIGFLTCIEVTPQEGSSLTSLSVTVAAPVSLPDRERHHFKQSLLLSTDIPYETESTVQ